MQIDRTFPEKQRLILRNAVFTLSRGGISLMISLALTPLYLGVLGIHPFGTWVLISVIATNLATVDFGLSAAMVRYIAYYGGLKDTAAINRSISSGLFLYLLFGGCYLILFSTLQTQLLAFFTGSGIPESAQTSFSLAGTFLVFFLNFTMAGFISILDGMQEIETNQKIGLAQQVFGAIVSIALLARGYGIDGLLISAGLATILGAALRFRRLLSTPQIEIRPKCIDRAAMLELLRFGLYFQVSNIANFLHSNIDKILLRYLMTTESVAIYEVLTKLPQLVRRVSEMILSPFIPAFAEVHASEDPTKLEALFTGALKVVVLGSLPLYLFLAAWGEDILSLWVGAAFEPYAAMLALMSLVQFINLTTGPGFYLLNSRRQLKFGMQSSLLAIILNLLFSWFLIPSFGLWGAVAGTASAMILAAGYFHLAFRMNSGIALGRKLAGAILPPLSVCLILLTGFHLVSPQWHIRSYLGLSFLGTGYSLACMGILLSLGFISLQAMKETFLKTRTRTDDEH